MRQQVLNFYQYEGAEFVAVPFTNFYMRFEFIGQDPTAKAHLTDRFRYVVDKDSAVAWMWLATHHSETARYIAMVVHENFLPESVRKLLGAETGLQAQ